MHVRAKRPSRCGDSYVRSPLSIAPLFNYRLYIAYIVALPATRGYGRVRSQFAQATLSLLTGDI